jgi:hypothetical protein
MALALLGVVALVAPPVAADQSRSTDAARARVPAADRGVPGNRPGQGLVYNGLDRADSGSCAGLLSVDGGERCTHGPDVPPHGYTMASEVTPLAPEGGAEALAATAAVCSGDGTSGNRVEALYVHAPGQDRLAQFQASLESWVVGIDTIYDQSARETGGSRHVRFVHDANCVPIVANVQISSTGISSFGRMADELMALGYNRRDRKYVVFAESDVYCGIGEFAGDTRKTEANRSNSGPSFARVDRSCWGAGTAAHELSHTLGAVNNDAPNSSGGGHCTDEWDVMCYSDEPNHPAMRTVCTDRSHDDLLDCGHDDYYHTHPDPGSYLGQSWNVADSLFLLDGGSAPPPPPPTTTTTVPPPPTTSGSTTTSSTTTTVPPTPTSSSTTSSSTTTSTTTTTSSTTTSSTTTTTTEPPTPTTPSTTSTTVLPPPPGPCDGYARRLSGTLAEGASQVQPRGWYFYARSGFHGACLDVPDGADFDVALQRFNGMRWVTVARTEGDSGDETVTFTGRFGIYRYLVTAVSGSGDYTLGYKRP